jgi:hypothetical protein
MDVDTFIINKYIYLYIYTYIDALKLTAIPTQPMIRTQTRSAPGHCTRRITNNRRTLRSLYATINNYRYYYPDIV